MKRLATALPAIMMLVFSLSAQGVTLLSNLDNPTAAGGFGGGPDAADHFQTGGQGLEVTAVNVTWDTANSPGVNQVLIYTDAGGHPSTATVGTPFTNPDVTTAGVMQYAGTALLAPNTVYWMVLDISDSSRVAYTLDDGFVADPSTAGAQILVHSAFGDNEAGRVLRIRQTGPGSSKKHPRPALPHWIVTQKRLSALPTTRTDRRLLLS